MSKSLARPSLTQKVEDGSRNSKPCYAHTASCHFAEYCLDVNSKKLHHVSDTVANLEIRLGLSPDDMKYHGNLPREPQKCYWDGTPSFFISSGS